MECLDRESAVYFIIDPNAFSVRLSDALRTLMGIVPSELSEPDFRRLIVPPDAAKLFRSARAMSCKAESGSSFQRLTLANGRRLFLNLIGSACGIRGDVYVDSSGGAPVDFHSVVAISSLIVSADGISGFLQIVADGVQETLIADRVALITIEDGGIEHFVKSGPGISNIVEVEYAELWDGLSGWVMRAGQTAFSPRGADDPRESAEVRSRRKETRCGDIIVAPLLHTGMVLGTLTAINTPEDPPFTDEDAAMVESLARMCASAVLGARSIFNKANQVDELYRLATHDELTGLYNRRMFATIAKRAISVAQRYGRSLALMFLDLDGFKRVNDTYGHYIGDCLLKEVAARLLSCVRDSETAARLGGDEFVVLFEAAPDSGSVESAVRRMLSSVGEPYRLGDLEPVRVGASAGIAFFPASATQYEDLMDRADQALYRAKREGRNTFRFYESPASADASEG